MVVHPVHGREETIRYRARFFRLVDRAAFSNPFSEERLALDRQIAGLPAGADAGAVVERSVGRVLSEVERLGREGRADLRSFAGEDRRLLHHAFLFDAFHRFAGPFDRLIDQQIAAGERPCPVPFAGEAMELLARRRYAVEEARLALAFFFQMRRAFCFIGRGLAGRCPSMRELRRHLWNNAFTSDIGWYDNYLWNRMEDFSTLLLGETGTGKGAAAAVPVQIKLLQVLQERTFSPVGGHDQVRFYGRVVAATHRRLPEMRRRGEFREDFFYRLCSDIIELPPLVDRRH